jgi:acetyl-CoA C-acetyltransferase
MPTDVFIVSAARTAIGRFGGSFRSVHPAELGAVAARAAMVRGGLEPTEIQEVVIGQARRAGCGPNPARQLVRRAGLPDSVPAQTINKACASGLQAVATAAQTIALGEADVVLAGGMESMSRVPYLIDAEVVRWGRKMGDATLVDAMYRDGFVCPLAGLIMGQTAEVLARQYGITREESDCYALGSQRRAEHAITSGRLADEIAPAIGTGADGAPATVQQDEHPRFGATLEGLKKLGTVFPEVDGHPGIITAGSSSGIADGAAALVLASGDHVRTRGLQPMGRVIGWASAGVDPRIMGIGPVPAMNKLFRRTDLDIDDFDLVELNEAFAPQVLAVLHEVPIPADRLNVNGGAIALGHPVGCAGARILVTLLYEMARRRARRGLATLCVSGGMGMALAVEQCAV